ncbi:MAG: hypothetical protein KDK33_05390 [Leptospiraceae bacterium]|nr:hypothetical protein [Leptospiraceae bacterium]
MKEFWNKCKAFYERLQKEKELRFKTSAACIVVVFLGTSILADANPLNLLIPGTTYPFPAYDHRETIPVYAIRRESHDLFKVDEKVLLDGTPQQNVHRLASVVATPAAGLTREFDHLVYAIPFPSFNLSIEKVWIEKGNLVLSLDGRSISSELERRFEGEKLESMKRPAALLDGYFKCLTLTLLETDVGADKGIQSVRYSVSHEESLEAYKADSKFSFDAIYKK